MTDGGKVLSIFLAGLAGFVVSSLVAEWASRKVWPRAAGN